MMVKPSCHSHQHDSVPLMRVVAMLLAIGLMLVIHWLKPESCITSPGACLTESLACRWLGQWRCVAGGLEDVAVNIRPTTRCIFSLRHSILRENIDTCADSKQDLIGKFYGYE